MFNLDWNYVVDNILIVQFFDGIICENDIYEGEIIK